MLRKTDLTKKVNQQNSRKSILYTYKFSQIMSTFNLYNKSTSNIKLEVKFNNLGSDTKKTY